MKIISHESGLYRVTIDYDDHHEMPEFDYGSPIIRFTSNTASDTDYGNESAKHDGIDGGGAEILDRLIRRYSAEV